MTEYTFIIHANLDPAQLGEFLAEFSPLVNEIRIAAARTAQEPAYYPESKSTPPARVAPAPVVKKERKQRVSKVNTALLKALESGPQATPTLGAALEAAGLSRNSLSTGLAVLQRENAVTRKEDGTYALAA